MNENFKSFFFFQKNYDVEIEEYKRYLENVYSLCHSCELKVFEFLKNQDNALLKKMDTDHLEKLGSCRGQNTSFQLVIVWSYKLFATNMILKFTYDLFLSLALFFLKIKVFLYISNIARLYWIQKVKRNVPLNFKKENRIIKF